MSIKGSVTITLDGSNKSTKLPLLSGSLGPDAFDIRKLYGDLEVFTYDPGYGATASCSSKITYIDGDEGILLYRGYPIEQLAEHSHFLEHFHADWKSQSDVRPMKLLAEFELERFQSG